MVKNHGDCCSSPKDRVVMAPLPNGRNPWKFIRITVKLSYPYIYIYHIVVFFEYISTISNTVFVQDCAHGLIIKLIPG